MKTSKSTKSTTASTDLTSAAGNSTRRLPPADAHIPAPPPGFVPTNGTDYRGLVPRKAELAVLPDVVAELGKFADYGLVFGKLLPPLPVVIDILNAAEQWSSMRAQSSQWDLYCRTQEGLAWEEVRPLLGKMRPAFTLAVSADAMVAKQNPQLARLLGVASNISKRGVASRKAKLKSETKKGGASPPTVSTTPSAQPAHGAPAPAPAASPAAEPTASPNPVVSMTVPPTAAAVNGATH
jgi:hypothetical protein